MTEPKQDANAEDRATASESAKPEAADSKPVSAGAPTSSSSAEADDKPKGSVEDESDDQGSLRAEVERLRAENAALVTAKSPGTFWRNASAGLLVIIGVLLVSMSISAIWLNRTIMDEKRWVETMAPLAKDAAIQDWVAKSTTDAIFANVDIKGYVEQALKPLPPQAAILASPITGAIQNLIRDAATKVTRSDQFADIWARTLELTHRAFIAAVTDKQSGAITKSGGTVTLDVSVLVDQVKAALADKGLGFVQNMSIPIASQQITLVDSPALAQLSTAISVMNTLAWLMPLLAIALLAGGVAIAANRRKAVLWMGIGIIALTVIPVQAIYLGQVPFANMALSLAKMPSAAAQAAYTIIFVNLIRANQIVSVVGLVFWIGALLAGPSAWATALRNGFRHGLNNVGPDWDFGVVGQWIHDHESGMRTVGIVLGIVMLLVTPAKTLGTIAWLVVFVVVWLVAVTFFGRPRPVAKPSAPAEESAADAGSVSYTHLTLPTIYSV